MTTEIYKPLKEHKPSRIYKTREISNFGNIKNINNKGVITINNGYNNNGYRQVRISGKFYKIHYLVYKYFIGDLPKDYGKYKMVIDHIDDNRGNNHYSNLQLITHKENLEKKKFNKQKKGSCYIKKNRNKKYVFSYYVDGKLYKQSFHTEAEQLELQKLYGELVEDGFII